MVEVPPIESEKPGCLALVFSSLHSKPPTDLVGGFGWAEANYFLIAASKLWGSRNRCVEFFESCDLVEHMKRPGAGVNLLCKCDGVRGSSPQCWLECRR
jgi:hypothetical protein